MAVDEFLSEYLQIEEEDRKQFDIIDTMIAKNDDDLIYVTFRDFKSIREIRWRVATIQNEEIKGKNLHSTSVLVTLSLPEQLLLRS